MDKFKMFSKFSALPFVSNYTRLLHTSRIISGGSHLGLTYEPHSRKATNIKQSRSSVCENCGNFCDKQIKRPMSSKESNDGDSKKMIEPKRSEKKNSEPRPEGIVLKTRTSRKESREARRGHVKLSSRPRGSKNTATVISILEKTEQSMGLNSSTKIGMSDPNNVQEIVKDEGYPKSTTPSKKVYIEYMEEKNRNDFELTKKLNIQSPSPPVPNHAIWRTNSDTEQRNSAPETIQFKKRLQPNTKGMQSLKDLNTSTIKTSENKEDSYLNNSPMTSANQKAAAIRTEMQLDDPDKKFSDVVERKLSTKLENTESKTLTVRAISKASTSEVADLPKLTANKPPVAEIKTTENNSHMEPSNSSERLQEVVTGLKNTPQYKDNSNSNETKLKPSYTASVKAKIEQSNDEIRFQNSKLTLSGSLPRTTNSNKTVKKETSGVFKLKTKKLPHNTHLTTDMKSPRSSYGGVNNKPLPKLDSDILQMKELPRMSVKEIKIQTDTPTNHANALTTMKLPISKKNSTPNPIQNKVDQSMDKANTNIMSQIKNNLLATATEKISQLVATAKIAAVKPLESMLGKAETSANSSTTQTDVLKTKSIVNSRIQVGRTSTPNHSNVQALHKTEQTGFSGSKVPPTSVTSSTNPPMIQYTSDKGGRHIIDYKSTTNQCPQSNSTTLPKNMFGDYMTPEQLKKNREKLKAFQRNDNVTVVSPSPKIGALKSTNIATTNGTQSKKFKNPTKTPSSSEDTTGGAGNREGSVSNLWGTLSVAAIYLALSLLIYMTQGMSPTNEWQHILKSLKEQHQKEATYIILPAKYKKKTKDLKSKQIHDHEGNKEQPGENITER